MTVTKRKKILLISTAIFLAAIILSIPAYYLYLNKVVIYEPVMIEIKGLDSLELQQIEIGWTTPLNQSRNFQKIDTNVWQNGYCFCKTLVIDIPDTIRSKFPQINISIGSKKFVAHIEDFKSVSKPDKRTHYILSTDFKSDGNFIQMILSVTHWDVIQKIFKIIYAIFIILFIFLIINKSKKELPIIPIRIRIFIEKLMQKQIITKQIRKWIKIIFYSLFAACILFFGFLLFVFTASAYITALLFIILTTLFIYNSFKLLFRKIKTREQYIKKLKTSCAIFMIIWISAETFLRVEGINASHNESRHLLYISGFNKRYKSDMNSPDLLVNPRFHKYIDDRNEFAFEINSNNEGLRDISHSVEKTKNEFRIICIGNSFTEGIGTPQDSTWPKLLEDRLNISSKKKISVFNAGKAGSDPFFGYMLLEKRMLKYQPDIVLLAVASSDFNFYRFRGGFERFTPNGYKFRKAPWWEKLYAVSYICRYITDNMMHYKYFFTPDEYKKDSIKAMTDLYNCIHKFYDLSVKENFKFALVNCDDGIYKLDPVIDSLKKEKTIPVIDLFEYIRNTEKISGNNRKDYYWPIDGHCNSKGYSLFARGVEWDLKRKGILDSLYSK